MKYMKNKYADENGNVVSFWSTDDNILCEDGKTLRENLDGVNSQCKDIAEKINNKMSQIQMKEDDNLTGDNKSIVGAINQLREDVNSGIGGGTVELTNYQKKNDKTLQTTSKEIVGAINEVNAFLEDNMISIKVYNNDLNRDRKSVV